MSPRTYRSAARREHAEQTRQRILTAARTMLATAAAPRLSVEAVAKQADVSRQTVYNAFGTKAGLLEALCDHLAERGGINRLGAAFAEPTPAAATGALVAAFCEFWRADRTATRRLRAMAVLDDDLGAVVLGRDRRRQRAVAALLAKLDTPEPDRDRLTALLCTVTGFASYDAVAAELGHREAVAALTGAACAVLGLPQVGTGQ